MRQPVRGSRRAAPMSTSIACGRLTGRSARRPLRGWTGRRGQPTGRTWRRTFGTCTAGCRQGVTGRNHLVGRVTPRLIVRRVKRLNPKTAPQGQDESRGEGLSVCHKR